MKPFSTILFVLLLACIPAIGAGAVEPYIWEDRDGVVHISDDPPASPATVKEIIEQPSPAPRAGNSSSGRHTDFLIENGIKYRVVNNYARWVSLLYEEKDFTALEKHIDGLLKANNEAKSCELYHLYTNLAELHPDLAGNRQQQVLDEWCGRSPDSHIPWLVRGWFLISRAWEIRTARPAKDVPPEAWPRFRAKLREALSDLEKARSVYRYDPNVSCFLITVAMGLSSPRERMEEYFHNGIAIWPWHGPLYSAKLLYLMPKWHGSLPEMFAFAEACLALSEQYPSVGFVMLEALNEIDKKNQEKEIFCEKGAWNMTHQVLTNFFTRYPDDLRRRFYYAYYAYKAKQFNIAAEQFGIIGDRWMGDTCWSSLSRYNRSRAFAYYKKGEDLLWKKNQGTKAIDCFQRALQYNPTANAWYGLGMAYWHDAARQEDTALLKRVEESLEKALLITPDHEPAQKQLGNIRDTLRRVAADG